MAVVKKVNVFAIVMLITIITLIVFLCFCTAYFFQVSTGVLPSNSQTMFMAWITIVILIILAFLMVYAFIVTLKGTKEYIPKTEGNKGTEMKRVSPEKTTIQMAEIPTSTSGRRRVNRSLEVVNSEQAAEIASNDLLSGNPNGGQ